ncbi:MAG TPA: response regulator transcription factor [Verrucomicrobiae bacterium]|jgi:DNA-binding NarL/FixJ family response regulator|nr:response regulator transcription factor [Verrucomicrobiae bacterium]
MPITVSIVEDDPSLCKGLARSIGQTKDIRCLGCYGNAEDALREIPQTPPEVVLIDINLPGMDGIECVRKLKELKPSLRIVMVTVYENPERIFKALATGAIGYVLKHEPRAELLDAIRDAHNGGAPMSSQIARKVVQFFHANAPVNEAEELSGREREVLEFLAKGYLIKEIADELGLGFDTVRTYIRRIYEKMHVHSRSQAVAKYFQRSPQPK